MLIFVLPLLVQLVEPPKSKEGLGFQCVDRDAGPGKLRSRTR